MSVEKRPNGTWAVRWREEGRHRRRSFTTKRDAVAFEAEVKRRLRLGAFAPPEPPSTTLRDFLVGWWDGHVVNHHAETTRNRWSSCIRLWIVPYIGGVKMRDLTLTRLRQWQTEILRRGCTNRQANQARTILSAAIGYAVDEDVMPDNVVRKLKRLPEKRAVKRAVDPIDIERVRLHLRGADRIMLMLLCYAGLRTSEALDVRWRDVTDHLIYVSPGKTDRDRTVEIIPALEADLRPARGRPDDYVVTSPEGRKRDLANWRRRAFRPALAAAGVRPFTPYEGRHTFASLLIHDGRSMLYVTAQMGHASATTTLQYYAHMFEGARRGERRPINEMIEEARARALVEFEMARSTHG